MDKSNDGDKLLNDQYTYGMKVDKPRSNMKTIHLRNFHNWI